MGGGQVGAGGVEGVDEVGGVVVGEGRVELVERVAGGGGEVGEGGDLAGDAAQVGGVAAGPFGLGAVGGAAFAGGLDALFAGGSGGAGPVAQVAAFGGLAAGDAEGWARSAQLAPASRAVSIRPVSHAASCSRTCRSSSPRRGAAATVCPLQSPARLGIGDGCLAGRRDPNEVDRCREKTAHRARPRT